MLWINEGFVLDDAGNVIKTSYVDLREPGVRTPIHTLVKGCCREHALEDSDTVLISPVKRFRKAGRNLIRDVQEGLAKEETETTRSETSEEAFRRRQVADTNHAIKLLDTGLQITLGETHRSVERTSKRLAFGTEWWIFSTAITPETEEEWAAWRATLDPTYDHESRIGQPAKFAQALGRMVTEQLGPQSRDVRLRGSLDDRDAVQSTHPGQWILHGPVVYADGLYDALMRDADGATRIARLVFTKNATHSAQREYRFAILRDGLVDKKVRLMISGMMRDSLQPITSGLVRPTPESVGETANEEAQSPSLQGDKQKLFYQRRTERERVTQRDARRLETRRADGRVLSSENEEREFIQERTVTRDLGADERDVHDATGLTGSEAEDRVRPRGEQRLRQGRRVPESGTTDEEVVKEITREESAASDSGRGTEEGVPVIHGATGRAYQSLEDMFREKLDDPAFPMGPTSERWAEDELSRQEVLAVYRMVATLAYKVTRVSLENREAASSASWHAIQCIRNIYVQLGDIVDTVAIERERFVVLQIKRSEALQATGRVVVAPSGVYAYGFRQSGREQVTHGGGELGKIFFPLGKQLETFESYGWPPKRSSQRSREGN